MNSTKILLENLVVAQIVGLSLCLRVTLLSLRTQDVRKEEEQERQY